LDHSTSQISSIRELRPTAWDLLKVLGRCE
jgi:hypothetical protein